MAAHGVIIAVAGPVEARVVKAIDSAPGLHVVRRCADLAEAAAAASAGLGSVVVLSDQPHLTRAVVMDLVNMGLAVVGVPTSPAAAEQLRTIGIDHFLAPNTADADVAVVVNRALTVGAQHRDEEAPAGARGSGGAQGSREPHGSGRDDGELIAVWGPTGAPGRTTVALNLATELALEGAQVLLVDADTYGGAIAQACGLTDEAPGLAAVARIAQHGSVDASVLSRHALEVAPHLRVLTGITRAERWSELPRAALDEVWRGARQWADVTVVDCGFGLETDEELVYDTHAPQRNGATLSALDAASTVLAVGSAEPLGMQRLVHTLPALQAASGVDPVVVVNRVRSEVAGPRPEEAVADALLRFAQVQHAWMVPWDPRACDAATLAGQSLAERSPRSKARRAIAGLARGLTTDQRTAHNTVSTTRAGAMKVGH